MKTTTRTKTKRNWIPILLLAIGMFSTNALWAFTASFTTTYGSAGAVTFTSTSTGTTSSTIYYWATGNGSPIVSGSTLSTYNYTYPYNGTYTAVLYISDTTTNAFDSTYATVTVTNGGTCSLVSRFYGSLATGGQVNFTSLSLDTNSGTTYSYDFGDGYSSSTKNPAHTYASNGIYYPTLTVYNGYGCTSTSTDTINMTTATGCSVSANFTVSYGVNGRVNFTSTSTGVTGWASYSWNPGDGSSVSNNTSYSTYEHTYLANGTYKVTLIVDQDSATCNSTDTMDITVTNVTVPCMLSAGYTYIVNAAGQVNFTSTSAHTNSGTEYYWNTGDGSGDVLGTSTLSHTYTIQGNYPVRLIIKDTGSAYCIDSIIQYVNVNTADSNLCGLHAGFTYTAGLNGHITFKSNSYTALDSSYSYLYNWTAGDGSATYSSYDSVHNYIYTTNGTYTVSLVVTTWDCKDSVSVPITISNVTTPCTLSANFNAINDTTKGVINIVSTSTGTISGTQYYWTPGDGSATILESSGSFNYTYTANGTYSGILTVENTGSAFCIDSIALPVNIANVDSLHAGFSTVSNYDTIGYYNYEFTSTSTGTNSNTVYAWEPGDSTAGDTGVNMTTYYHTYKYAGAHTVTLSLWFDKYPVMPGHKAQGFGGTRYDFTTYSQTVYVGAPQSVATISASNSETKLYPNPNNGSFRIVVNGVTDNKDAEVEITNILGEVVYQTTANASNGMISKDITLPGVSNGTYFVRVITSGNVYNSKTVINK
jgi:PKD repeat protein